jgi:FemAB-related protein (PEP-CTERM system-associated)
MIVAPSSSVHVSRIDGESDAAWRDVVDCTGEVTLAHAPEWRHAIAEAYGHQSIYLIATGDDGSTAVLPSFVLRRPLIGSVVASMPFLDGGGPSGRADDLAAALIHRLMTEATLVGARAVELRSTRRLPVDGEAMDQKVNLMLTLPTHPDQLWRRLDKSVRNQVRKAERSGLSVEIDGVAGLPAFFEAFAERMRDLGSPVHAPGFLAAVLRQFGDRARLVLIRKGRATVGGLVALAFKDRIAVPWATCRKEYFPLCPNMLLYWETLRLACSEGFSRFDFGRSSRGSGTYRFKRQWGAEEEPLHWYTIPLAPGTVARAGAHHATRDFFARAWRRLPLPIATRFGPSLRRYLTQ